MHWVHMHPPPPGKKFRIEEKKFRPDMSVKKECARSAQIRQNENEKGREKKKKRVKGKGQN